MLRATHYLKTMRKYLILTLFLKTIYLTVNAQTVEVLKQTDFVTQEKDEDFAFIEPTTDVNSLTYVGTIKSTGVDKLAGVENLFFKLKEKAHELGANCFVLNDFKQGNNPQPSILTLDIYNGNDSILNLNFANHEKNVIYIFGSEKRSNAQFNFRLDNVKKEFNSGTFYRHENKEGQEVKINKGGLTGMTLWIKWRENKPSTFLTLTGFGLGGGTVPYGTVGVAFNTGRISYIDGNLGHLLIQLIKTSE